MNVSNVSQSITDHLQETCLQCEFSSSHTCVVEGPSLLVSDTARIKESAWNLKMMTSVILRNFGNHSPNDTPSLPSRPESSHVLETTESFNICEYVKYLILLGSDFVN